MTLLMVGVLVLVALPSLTIASAPEPASYETPGCQGSPVSLNRTGGYPNCLQLEVSLSSTQLSVGQSLRISVDLVNPLPHANNISTMETPPYRIATDEWQFGGFPIFTWPNCISPRPLQFIVVKGNFTAESLSASDPAGTISGVFCAEPGDIVTQFAFPAGSDRVNMTAVDCISICTPYPGTQLPTSYPLESSFSVTGYWNATYARMNPLLTASVPAPNGGDGSTYPYPEVAPLGQIAFVPGVYTLAVSSMWGQAEVIHFTVK